MLEKLKNAKKVGIIVVDSTDLDAIKGEVCGINFTTVDLKTNKESELSVPLKIEGELSMHNKMNGLTQETLEKYGKNPTTIAKKVSERLNDVDAIIVYNKDFVIPMVNEFLYRNLRGQNKSLRKDLESENVNVIDLCEEVKTHEKAFEGLKGKSLETVATYIEKERADKYMHRIKADGTKSRSIKDRVSLEKMVFEKIYEVDRRNEIEKEGSVIEK